MKCENCGLDNLAEAHFCANCGAALIITSKQPLPAEPIAQAEPATAIEYTGFWTRFVAAIIDVILVSLLSYALFFLVRALSSGYFFLYTYFNPLIILLLYHWLFVGLRGQTPGKILAGIRVVDSQGNKPSLAIAALREIPGKIISTIVLYLGFIWIALDSKKQGWHDKIASTYVIKAETVK